MPLITINLAVGKIILLPYAHKLFLENSRLLYRQHGSHVFRSLLTSVKPLIALTIGCCPPSSLILLIAFLASLQHVCVLRGTVGNPCSCVGKMSAVAILVVTKVCDEEVYCHLFCLGFIFVI